jgi:aminoglycoside phosphotransferase (APT) family kinase protein
MNKPDETLSIEAATNLISSIKPGSRLKSVAPIAGGYSNHTHLIEMIGPDGADQRIVVRRYSSGNREPSQKAVREFKVLQLIRKYGIPAPAPLYLDDKGAILGIPGIATSYIDGQSELRPANPEERAAIIAEVLTKLHSIPLDITGENYLLNTNAEATWFLRDSNAEETVKAHPLGTELLNFARGLSKNLNPTKLSLVHTDIWPGNLIWKDNKLSGIVDWDDTGYGDPALDIGYSRMELSLSGYFNAADILLREYENRVGRQKDNLLFWEAAAAVKPIYKPEIWDVVNEPRSGNFARYIEGILRKSSKPYEGFDLQI